MDCRDFKEMLDSYFCQELAVETNHAILGHAEHCLRCRNEMASRRNLREALQRACAQDQMSDAACERLRMLLRKEAGGNNKADVGLAAGWRERLAKLFELRVAFPALATLALIIGSIGIGSYLWRANQAGILPLSNALIAEAAQDHRKCSREVGQKSQPMEITNSATGVDPACLGLEKIAEEGAEGLKLCSAHFCDEQGRRFVHLIYKRDGQLISLLVTPRDERAMKIGQVPSRDVSLAGVQEFQQTELALDAYQTTKRVVLVVSALPKPENERLARTLAMPVVRHLRRMEDQTAVLNWPGFELITNVRGGELR
ncbi:MAG: hypothetical protein ABI977_19980 [Acidobacteriota bacterium]